MLIIEFFGPVLGVWVLVIFSALAATLATAKMVKDSAESKYRSKYRQHLLDLNVRIHTALVMAEHAGTGKEHIEALNKSVNELAANMAAEGME